MTRSAQRSRSRRRPAQTGFTLIEMLVVALIIGVVLSFVALSVNPTGAGDRLDTEARRLDALVGTAAEDAILYGREIGLDIVRGGYRFLRLGDDGWQPIADPESPLRERELGAAVVLALIEQDDAQPLLAGGEEEDDDEDTVRPEAIFLSSSEIVPFELELYADGVDHRFRLRGEANGEITLERVGAAR